MYFVMEGNFTNSAPAIPSVNDCTGSHSSNFEPNRITKTGNSSDCYKSNSIVACACSDTEL